MIHIGIQYTRLVQNTANILAQDRLVHCDALTQVSRLEKQLQGARRDAETAEAQAAKTCERLNRILVIEPSDAVAEFKSQTGKYPCDVTVDFRISEDKKENS